MISSAIAARLARRNIHYGWIVVTVTFLTMLVTAGAVGAPGVLILPLQQEFGWKTAEISTEIDVDSSSSTARSTRMRCSSRTGESPVAFAAQNYETAAAGNGARTLVADGGERPPGLGQ